jgi:hypothetical protein
MSSTFYDNGSAALLLGGVGFVFGATTAIAASMLIRGKMFRYKVWTARLLWMVTGAILFRVAVWILDASLSNTAAPSIVTASLGLSGFWAYMIVEWGIVSPMLERNIRDIDNLDGLPHP